MINTNIGQKKFFLEPIKNEEADWIKSLSRPFSSNHIEENKVYEVFILDQNNHHPEFNPFCSMIFYFQYTHIGEKEEQYNTRKNQIYYINQPLFKPSGTFSIDRGSQTMTCLDGCLHDSSGAPAMISTLFGPAYYLHGTNYEPIEYFRFLEDQRKHRPVWFYNNYSNYDPQKYIEFMANLLGQKSQT